MATARSMSLKFEDHVGILHVHAKKCFARCQDAGLSKDYDDVFAMMSETYAKCLLKFDPELGISFTAYFGRACMNNFNKEIEKELNEKFGLGLTSIEDLSSESDDDPYGWIATTGDRVESPEDRLERRQQVTEAMRSLSQNAKAIVREIINPSKALQDRLRAHNINQEKIGGRQLETASVAFIGKALNLDIMTIRKVKDELGDKFGIRF